MKKLYKMNMSDEFVCEFCQDTGIEFEMCCKSAVEAARSLCGCGGEPEEMGPCLHCQGDE
jgi:hypothetical protein